jgi:hypothetical protein
MKELETLAVDYTVSNFEAMGNPDWVRDMIREKIIAQLGSSLANSYFIKTERGDYSTTYMARVIVASPDEFYRLVEEYAITRRFPTYGAQSLNKFVDKPETNGIIHTSKQTKETNHGTI